MALAKGRKTEGEGHTQGPTLARSPCGRHPPAPSLWAVGRGLGLYCSSTKAGAGSREEGGE